MRSPSSHPRTLALFVALIVALALVTGTLALGIRPLVDQATGVSASVTRPVPPPAQLPAVPPPLRTDLPPLVPDPTPDATHRRPARATRIILRYLGIDLPIISRDRKVQDQGPDLYPPCDVAIYHTAFEQPGQPGTTYLYG